MVTGLVIFIDFAEMQTWFLVFCHVSILYFFLIFFQFLQIGLVFLIKKMQFEIKEKHLNFKSVEILRTFNIGDCLYSDKDLAVHVGAFTEVL